MDIVETILINVALAWVFWLVTIAFFDRVVSGKSLPEQSFDASMLRLLGRIFALVGALTIVSFGLNQIGLPVLSILAGLGIGGLAIALAIRPTLENLIGGFILYLDRPVRVGDFCTFGEHKGEVHSIGIRSTQIRALDRTIISIPNSQFADMQLINWARCDKMLIGRTLGLRYETETEQMRYVLAKIREMLHAHPRIESDTVRVRFDGHGAFSLDISIRIYALTAEWNDFFAIQEDVFLHIDEIVRASGAGFAFPSQTLYLGRDTPPDETAADAARRQVANWRRSGRLPFPDFAPSTLERLASTIAYPPKGAQGSTAMEGDQPSMVEERLSAEPAHYESTEENASTQSAEKPNTG
jgi:MscS family membrane protein